MVGRSHGKAHFASIALRSYDQIFKTTIIKEVVEGQGDPPRLLGLPLPRWVGTVGFVAGIVLNTVNIIKAFTRNLPRQRALMQGMQDGSLLTRRAECLAAGFDAVDAASSRCTQYEESLDQGFVTVLVVAELGLLLLHVVCFLTHFAAIRGARTDIASLANSVKWIQVAESFEWLGGIGSASALKILPQIKRTPAQLKAKYTMEKERLTEDDGEFDTGDKLYLGCMMVGSILAMVVVSFAGIIALHLKLVGLKATLDIPIGRWGWPRWIAFLGFANQIAGLVPIANVEKARLLYFIFTGVDAEMSNEEKSAMHQFNGQLVKKFFHEFGSVRGFLVANTFNDNDLQKCVLMEHATTELVHHHDHHPPHTAMENSANGEAKKSA